LLNRGKLKGKLVAAIFIRLIGNFAGLSHLQSGHEGKTRGGGKQSHPVQEWCRTRKKGKLVSVY